MKKCFKCKLFLSFDSFTKASSRKNGLQGMCKICKSKYEKFRRETNTNHKKIVEKAYKKYSKTEKAKEKSRRNHKNNNDKEKEQGKRYYHLNKKDRKTQHKIWYEQNKDKINEYNKIRLKNPYWNFSNKIRCALRRSFKLQGLIKQSNTFELLGFTPKELFNHLSFYLDKPCELCKTSKVVFSENGNHMDHITPISFGNSLNDIIKLNQLNNLRLICPKCNLEKSNSYEYT